MDVKNKLEQLKIRHKKEILNTKKLLAVKAEIEIAEELSRIAKYFNMTQEKLLLFLLYETGVSQFSPEILEKFKIKEI